MQDYLSVLERCPLFAGSSIQEIEAMLHCLTAQRRSFPQKALLYEAGAEAYELGVLLEGSLDIVQEDFWGNQGMLARLTPGMIFAESFVLAHVPRLPVSVVAQQPSTVLMMDYRRVLHTCTHACPYHERLIHNLLLIVAQKNVYLTEKMEILSKKTIREKLLAYLSAEAQRAGRRSFTIPYDRQALADYLAVDRSALSRALSAMQEEGMLSFHRSRFELNDK